jgi:endonuclease/exonuclease/phosphatase family metal-dependent hydrolase
VNDASPRPMTVMTFNVLCSICGGGEYDPWDDRLGYFADIFARHDPDLIGIQELTPINGEVDAVLAQAPGHEAVFYAPAEGGLPYPDATIFFRKERFSLVERGEYWLSPTPDEPSSTGFSSPQLPRLLVWAVLRDRADGRELYFASTHFDNNSPSQELSAPLVLERTAPFVDQGPVIVVGDFNSQPTDVAYATLTTDQSHGFAFENVFDLAAEWRVENNLEPAPDYDLDARIDHLFVVGDPSSWAVSEWIADLTVYGPNQRYPSDHFAIVATLEHAP